MRRFAVGATLAMLVFAGPAAAQDARYLPFTGDWIGTGEARGGPDQPWEPASCEITIEWQRGLRSHGVCEGVRGRFSAGGLVTVDGNEARGGFLVPHFIDLAQGPTVELAEGALVGHYVLERDGVNFWFALTVRREGNTLTMRTEVLLDGRYQEVGHLTLEAR